MIKKIVLVLFFSFVTASAQGAATDPVGNEAEHINLWEAAAALAPNDDPKEAYSALIFAKIVWLHTFGRPCTDCSTPGCTSRSFFKSITGSLLLQRTTLADTLNFCSTIACLQSSAAKLKELVTIMSKYDYNFHLAGTLFDLFMGTVNGQLKQQLSAEEQEACLFNVQLNTLLHT